MTRGPRRIHIPAFKAKVALAAIRGEQTLMELSQQFDVRGRQALSAMKPRPNLAVQPLMSKRFMPRSAN